MSADGDENRSIHFVWTYNCPDCTWQFIKALPELNHCDARLDRTEHALATGHRIVAIGVHRYSYVLDSASWEPTQRLPDIPANPADRGKRDTTE